MGRRKKEIPKEDDFEEKEIEESGEEEEIGEESEDEEEKDEFSLERCRPKDDKPMLDKDIKEHNKILRNVLIGIFVFIAFFAIGFYFMNTTRHFNYDGITFNVIKEKEVTFYHTSFQGTYGKIMANYNIFIRTDPRKLEEIPFEGKFYPSEMMVLNSSENFNCDGDGVIAVANLQQVMGAFGTTVISDPNATCDERGRYLYVNMQSGDKTEITSPGNKCFNININNCEVLKGTERFLLEVIKYYSN